MIDGVTKPRFVTHAHACMYKMCCMRGWVLKGRGEREIIPTNDSVTHSHIRIQQTTHKKIIPTTPRLDVVHRSRDKCNWMSAAVLLHSCVDPSNFCFETLKCVTISVDYAGGAAAIEKNRGAGTLSAPSMQIAWMASCWFVKEKRTEWRKIDLRSSRTRRLGLLRILNSSWRNNVFYAVLITNKTSY